MRRRRLTAWGIQPVGPTQHVCEWFDVSGAVALTTGERCGLERPSGKADMCPRCLDAFAQVCPESLTSMRLENSEAHTAQRLHWPDNVYGVWWPPDCPELNPMARVWRDLQDTVAGEPCADLAAPLDAVADRRRASDAATLQSLSGYPSWANAMNALSVEGSHIRASLHLLCGRLVCPGAGTT